MLKGVGFAVGVLVLLLTFCSIALDHIWVFDVLASLRLQIVAGCAILGAVALLFRRWYAMGLLVGGLLVNTALMLPPIMAEPHDRAGPHTLRMVFYNSAQNTLSLFPLRAFVKQRQPDLLAFTEVQRWDIDNLRASFPDYRHSVGEPGVFGAVILSKVPIHSFQVHETGGGPSGRTLEMRLCDRMDTDRCLALLVLHPTPPLNAAFHASRDRHLMAAAERASLLNETRTIDGRVIMAGDFNLTPWNRTYVRALETGGLRDAFAARLPHSTWFSSFAVAGLPIDHIWTGAGVGVTATEIGPLSGSDHLPIYAELNLDIDLR